MDPSIRTAATGMAAQQTRVEVISNNLANVNTTGFKRSRAHFEDLLYQTARAPQGVQESSSGTIPEIQVGRGTRLAGVQRVYAQGPIQQTGRSLDLAIEGEGFFQVRMPNGTMAYTRDGSFGISDQGVLVTQGGYEVVPGVSIPSDVGEIGVSRTGVVTTTLPGTGEVVELGRIEVARFTNPAGLRTMGQNLLQETSASGEAVSGFPQDEGLGRIVQGALEGSNVEIVQEMVEMITALRAYEINSKAVQTGEQLSEIANNLVR